MIYLCSTKQINMGYTWDIFAHAAFFNAMSLCSEEEEDDEKPALAKKKKRLVIVDKRTVNFASNFCVC